MGKLTQIGTLNGGKVYVPSLTTGYAPSPMYEYTFFLQTRCRLVFEDMTSAVRVVFMISASPTDMTLWPDVNGMIYMPLNDVLAAEFDRVRNTTMTLSGVYGTIEYYAIDGDGNILDQGSIAVNVCDCTGLRSGYDGGRFDHMLPDTFRFPSVTVYNEWCYVGCRLTRGINTVELYSGGNMYGYTQSLPDGRAVCCNLKSKGVPTSVKVYEDTDVLIHEARFDLVDCLEDKLLLMWWSVEDGIWKSRVADITGDGVDGINTTDYIRDFDDRQAKDSTTYVAAKFADLTSNDYCYYRDLLTSDEVYVVSTVDTADNPAIITPVPVTIDGDIPTTKYNRRTTIDFNIIYAKFSEL